MKERILLIAACGLLTASPIAWSQCATGVNTGGGNCVPPDASGMPGYDPGNVAPPTIQPQWADSRAQSLSILLPAALAPLSIEQANPKPIALLCRIAAAKAGAMESCNETKNQCAVVYSACSVARRIQ